MLDLRLGVGSWRSRDGVVHEFLGGTPAELPERYAPRRRPSGCRSACPALVTHGGRDDIVPPVISERFAAAARAAGDDVDARGRAGRGPLRPPRPGATRCGAAVTAWLAADAAPRRGGRRRRPARRASATASSHADERIYLDGNSLGRLPVATRDAAGRARRRSGASGSSAAGRDWIDAPTRAGDAIAEVIGAGPGEVLVCDSTTVNLYKLVGAAIDARGRRGALVTDRGNFPTDRYVLEGIAAQRGLALRLFDGEPEAATLPCGPGDVVVLSHVGYRTRRAAPTCRRSRPRRRERGATLIWDLSHSAGAVPVDLRAAGAELAVGCTYKYLNAGPGAPGLPVRRAPTLQDGLRSPIRGWFGQREQFAMERALRPASRHPPLPRRHAADPRPRRGRGGRAS